MTGRGHKHKRGERGSTRGTATLKRSNMAVSLRQDEDLSSVTHEPTNEQHKPERNLIELHESLVDIQINVNDILRENKEIRSEMEELKSTVSRQTNKISTLKTAHLQKINNQYQEVEKQLYAANRHVDEQQEEINELYDLQDKLEQHAECHRVRKHPDDIESSHKLNRKRNKPIIVKFVSHKTITRLKKARVNLRNIKLPSLFPRNHSPNS